MFLRYSDSNKIINLDNFDELAVETEMYNVHKVLAKRYANDEKCQAILPIKVFERMSDAQIFYEVLQHAWASRETNIYEIK